MSATIAKRSREGARHLGELASVARSVEALERQATDGREPEALLVDWCRRRLDERTGSDEVVVEFLARVDAVAPRTEEPRDVDHVALTRRARVLARELEVLKRGLVTGTAATALSEWLRRESARFMADTASRPGFAARRDEILKAAASVGLEIPGAAPRPRVPRGETATASRLRSIESLIATAEHLAAEGRPEPLVLERARSCLDAERPGRKRVELMAKLDRLYPRTGGVKLGAFEDRRRAFIVLEAEIAALALLDGAAAENLRAWVGRQVERLQEELGSVRLFGLGGVERARAEDERLEKLIAAAKVAGVKIAAPRPHTSEDREHARRVHEEAERLWREARARGAAATSANTEAERDTLARELGVDLRAGEGEIKRQLRALAFEAHPDRGGTHERIVKVNRLRELTQPQ